MRISDWSSDVCSSDLRRHWRGGMEGLLATGPGRYQIRIAAGEAELAAQLLLLARIAQTGGQRQQIDWLVVDLSVHRSGMRLRRIARIVVRRDRKSTRLNSSH